MVNYRIPIDGYIYLYRSLLRFCDMNTGEAKELLYTLNTANIDSYAYSHPDARLRESSPLTFCRRLDICHRPYRTEVQLYKSLCALLRGIDREAITAAQCEAASHLCCMTRSIEYRFFRTYGLEIDDMRTVYSLCAWNLVPKDDEPSVCLLKDWVLLPSA
jgi:hypothetical protein